MKHKLITIFILIILISLAIIYTYRNENISSNIDISTHVQQVTSSTELIDINTDHNQILDVYEYMTSNKINIPSTLINFDTHSDIFVNSNILRFKESSVASWVNNLLAKYPEVEEIYWVLPPEVANDTKLNIIFADNDLAYLDTPQPLYGNSLNPKISLTHMLINPLSQKAYKQELLVDPITGNINENTDNDELVKSLFGKDKSQLRKVTIISCTEKTLPNLKDKDILLSIDADYTSNSGYDTIENFRFVKTEAGINATFYSIFKTLEEKNITPRIISLSLSPQYLPTEHHEHVSNIFEKILRISNKKDKIKNYKNKYFPPEYYTIEDKKAGN